MRACVITVGNEILKGRTINTNAADIGRMLYFAGYEIYRGITVSDNREEIGWAFRTCLDLCDVVVSSGGLGPTFDDMTVSSFAHEFNIPLVMHSETYNRIKEKFEKRGMEMTEEREKMALIPEKSSVIRNNVGSAPGVSISLKGKRIFILPGVPREMKPMMESVIQEVRRDDSFYTEESVLVKGIPESALAPLSSELMKKYGGRVYIKTHPGQAEDGESLIEVEISSRSQDRESGKKTVREALDEFSKRAEEIRKEIRDLE